MSRELLPEGSNDVVRGLTVPIELAEVPAAEVVAGSPRHGVAELGTLGGVEAGIWELRGGTVTDTEVDEMFIVLSGGALIEFLADDDTVRGSAEVAAGDVMRLVAGSRTRWVVADHIRKVYLAAE